MPRLGFQNTSQGGAFFVNLTSFVASQHAFDASGNNVEVAGVNGTSYAAGELLVRDLGKTIRVPGQTIDAVWTGRLRTLRKVQIVGQANQVGFPVTNHFIGYNEGVSGGADVFQGTLPSGFATFYVDFSGQNSGVRFARLSVQ
jgi:hypothetical protein